MKGQRILITGGTGSVGSALVADLIGRYPNIGLIRVFSNQEQEQFELAARFPSSQYPVQYLMGDVRDRERILAACQGMDVVVHAAAMKHVAVAEINPMECAKTNILGSQNLIEAAVANAVPRVVALSTDKAVAPINIYGASKLFLERLFIHANSQYETRFTVVRYANVLGSKGSVVPVFLTKRAAGFLPITHPDMTRFSITMDEGLAVIRFAIEQGWGGEVIIPKAPSYRILDVAEAIAPGLEQRIVGVRLGEKIHELLLSVAESPHAVDVGPYYVVCPSADTWTVAQYIERTGARLVPLGFEYDSGRNQDWLTVERLRDLVAECQAR